ncbi:hypothetical protein RC91_11000 [Pectobacterium brasiliense]|nr:hypothetical protein NC16_04780 [Pectobacterium brasiliense]KFF64439.1 hypothetical protein IW00_15380 [Pectobacterium brasiliense]KHS79268.1 hypothetical protein RC81_11435 [Pectobacterium brasiliense]KHT03201.1 hypothetical protein RC91_11000 [Pectobacterium brasiliense]
MLMKIRRMDKVKKTILFLIISVIYIIFLFELVFKYLPEKIYLFIAKLTNPFNIMNSSLDSLIIFLVLITLLLSWLTTKLIVKKLTHR